VVLKTRPDVVVVGTGAGGAAVAWRLSELGLRVLALEAGPRFDQVTDYRLTSSDWELGGFPEKTGSRGRTAFAALQALNESEADLRSWNKATGQTNKTGRRDVSGPGYYHVRGVGGTTLGFVGEAHRMHPAAMRMHSDYGVGCDWPLAYADLEPYYVIAERLLGVAGPATPEVRWRSAPYPLPAHRLCRASAHLAEAGKKLGMHWLPNARAALSEPYDGRPACNYCGNCSRGCPLGDKGSTDVTFIRHAEASGLCEIVSDAVVTRIETAGRRVSAVRYVRNGRERRIETPILILAAGAIETPKLLLANRGSRAPEGLANGSRQVGRNLLETLHWASTGLVAEDLRSHMGLPADAICWDYNHPTAIAGVVGGCRFNSTTQEIGLVGPIAYATRLLDGFGASLKQNLRMAFGHALSVGAIGEFLPNDGTFVDLHPTLRDATGLPVARIHSRLTRQDIDRLRFMASTARKLLQAAGATMLVEEQGSYDFFASTHLFGTCRMGQRGEDSVVDAHGRSHEIDNLYITDASVFPSSGGGESPSLTIEALAIRTADHIAKGVVIPPSTPPA